MKTNRKGRITAHTPKQIHKPVNGFIRSCTASLDGLKVHLRDSTPESILSRKRNGFTLLEIMIVVCIIGILAAIAVPSYVKRVEYARALATVKNTVVINTAIHDWMLRHEIRECTFGDCHEYPSRYDEVETLLTGGFQGCQVEGYTLDLLALQNAYISIIAFRGVEPSELYISIF